MPGAHHWSRRPSVGVLATAWVVLVLATTAVQAGALVIWLAVLVSGPALSVASLVGLLVLVGGLIAHHVLTDVAVNGPAGYVTVGRLVALGVLETGVWILWLLIADVMGGENGLITAALVLVGTLVFKHSVEDNVLRGDRPLADGFDAGTVGYSLIATLAATAWLSLVALDSLLGVDPAVVGLGGVDPWVAGSICLVVGLLVARTASAVYARY